MTFAGEFLGLPGLRGYWPMGVFDSLGNAFDQSGNGRTLTYTGNPTYNFTTQGGPYIDLDGTGDYLSRADEGGLDILGTESYIASAQRGLTFGGWFYFDATPAAGLLVIGKGAASGNDSFYLWQTATGLLEMYITSTGANYQNTTGIAIANSAWSFCVGRFTPSTEIKCWLNTTTQPFTTSVHASLFNSSAAFKIGFYSANPALDGRAGMCFVCAMALTDTAIENIRLNTKAYYGL